MFANLIQLAADTGNRTPVREASITRISPLPPLRTTLITPLLCRVTFGFLVMYFDKCYFLESIKSYLEQQPPVIHFPPLWLPLCSPLGRTEIAANVERCRIDFLPLACGTRICLEL